MLTQAQVNALLAPIKKTRAVSVLTAKPIVIVWGVK